MTTWIAPPAIVRPTLTKPVVVKVDYQKSLPRLDQSKDYILVLPTRARIAGMDIKGGRNILLVGGYCSTAAGHSEPNITVHDGAPGRTVHLEGLRIDGDKGGYSDAFHLQCPNSRVQIKTCAVARLRGSMSTTHADVIQNLGCLSLRVEEFTGRSYSNDGYMRRENYPVVAPVGPVYFNQVNMGGYNTNPYATGDDPTHTIRAVSLGTQPQTPGDPTDSVNGLLSGPVWFYEFYANHSEAGVSLGQFVWPHDGARMQESCRADVADDGLSVDWPLWRTATTPPPAETTPSTYGVLGSGDAKVYGVVKKGPPVGGDFVALADVGLSYPRAA